MIFWFFSIERRLYRKFELRPGETLKVTTIKFGMGLDIYNAETSEPIDRISFVEFTNVKDSNG
jgi:hypothetical protein